MGIFNDPAGWATSVFGHGAHVDIDVGLIAVEELLGLRWVDGLYAHGVNLLSGK